MRYYIIAGEASGDLHGSGLVHALRAQDSSAEIRAWGGDRMEAAGATIVKHYRDLAFMGFVEVLKHLRTILRNIAFCKADIQQYQPDVLVLIDYPGFNLRIAKWARAQGLRVVYYISPQVWAWKEGRVRGIKTAVHRMLVILPFEVDFYRKWDYAVDYVGHPLAEFIAAEQAKPLPPGEHQKPILALLPGSRKMELAQKLPVMLRAAAHFPDCRIVVAGAPSMPAAEYAPYLQGTSAELWENKTYELLRQARAALVTSGTATLETALFGVPQVVCYRGNPISFWLAKRLVKVKWISLVNLIMDRSVVPELIQHDLTEANIVAHLRPLLTAGPEHDKMVADYAELQSRLQEGGASAKAAAIVIEEARKHAAGKQ